MTGIGLVHKGAKTGTRDKYGEGFVFEHSDSTLEMSRRADEQSASVAALVHETSFFPGS